MFRSFWFTLMLVVAQSAGGRTDAGGHSKIAHLQWDAAHGTELTGRDTVTFSKDLTGPDRTALLRAIKTKLRPQMADMDIHTETDLTRVATETRIKPVDLDGDGISEVVAQSTGMETCGAVGNCLFWVFKKTGAGYTSILDSGSQTFVIEETQNGGFFDLTLGSHDSASEKHLYLYQFSRGKYREVGCYDANWTPNLNELTLKRPVITKC